ncbi:MULTISPECIES: glycosyltransferase family 39 protein [Pseudoxanthomonas]|uniref:4-amino-4-deoxy-L-arabinose transferase-like glycosyltransferase n=1 Tax=Pseudoxanthomonas winnipegensis TaxID=2480810 RepID=A0AAW8G6L2_9GAMM|nr:MULTISPECIES: glycosyltransferase family 39 protein [Pseudoxanthomonas]MDQ1118014.1 4-amino-4-deoxy-L-arabinose transferase-like glycosyltransferase [Pseudoxanthomonas winnipegensis]MDQ1134984.1 4-amino-4-deoxy-L-arabinose transferase-like glycosyltransferase [Pseudoxanthomonas winnipegensis]MDR6138783.1 4-amino-4-deoxy-L-arabinose transferase-like glycosyltransferase [Pseudoxanthomonas sp. SORGH_AS_0997]
MRPMTYAKTRSLDTWLLFITALLVIGAGIGLRDPWPADEPRFTLVAKHMVESGDWLFPHRGVELYSDKPPMLMWLEGLFFLLTGNWRVAFLMPSLLATLGAIWCVKDLGQRLWTRKVGLYAGWALLFAFQFTYQAKRAQIDALVLGMITLANYGLLRHLLKGPDWKMWVLGWFFAGLGTITKGVGFLALLSIVPAAVVSARGWPGVKVWAGDRRFWLGPLAFLVAVSIWLVPMVATVLLSGDPEHRAYLNDILLRQTAKRYARSWDHPQPWWYFLQVLLMWAPTILALPWAIAPWARRLRLRRDPRYLVPLAWWLIVMVFFSIPHGKRDVYIMPALPMLCLALAPLLPGLLRRRDVRGVLHVFTAVLVLATLGMGIAMLTGEPSFERGLHRDRDLDQAATHALAWVLVAIGTWGLGSLLAFWRRPAVAMCSTLGATWVLYGMVVCPLLNDSSSARGVMREVAQSIGPQAELGLVAWKEQNLLMSQSNTTTFGFRKLWKDQLREGLAWQAQAPQRRWLLVQDIALPACIDRGVARHAGQAGRRGWWLVPMAARTGCPASPEIPFDDSARKAQVEAQGE